MTSAASSPSPFPAPQLTVVVPCHNEQDTLGQQLEALTTQVWDGAWEIVVVDNNSTDDTVEVALRFADGAVPLQVVSAIDGTGVAYARNTGVRASTGVAVAFCDGDDVVQPGWVAAMGSALVASPLVAGAVDVSLLNPDWLAQSRPTSSLSTLPQFGDVPFARGNNCGMHRSVWSQLEGFDEDFVGLEDIEFSLRAAAAGHSPALASDAVVAYRYRPTLGAVWRQGFFYGRGRPALSRQASSLGLSGPPRLAGLKSWAWLLAKLPTLASPSGRAAWTWVLANRMGNLRGLVG